MSTYMYELEPLNSRTDLNCPEGMSPGKMDSSDFHKPKDSDVRGFGCEECCRCLCGNDLVISGQVEGPKSQEAQESKC